MGSFLGGGDPETPPDNINTGLSEYYVTPTGTGTGTQADPTNLNSALQVSTGKTIHMTDGVYTQDTVILLAGATLQAVNGARPVVKHTDGKPPSVTFRHNCTVSGAWFGGTKADVERAIQTNDGVTVQNCTFFGYYGGFAEGGNTNHHFTNNRFVNCGTGSFYHDFYISNPNHAAGGCVIQGNIHIGGGGYKAHIFGGSNVDLLNNFYGDVQWGAAVYGNGNTVQDNIFWSNLGSGGTNITMTIPGGYDYAILHNVIGLNTSRIFYSAEDGQTMDGNAIVDGAPADNANDNLGTNKAVWQEADIVTNLGNSSANIQAAVDALESAFGQTVQEIHDDATIEGHFTTLQNVLNAWAAA